MYHAKTEVIQKWVANLLMGDKVVKLPWDIAPQFREALEARGIDLYDEYETYPGSDTVIFTLHPVWASKIHFDIWLLITIRVVHDKATGTQPCPHYMPAGCCRVCAADKFDAMNLEV